MTRRLLLTLIAGVTLAGGCSRRGAVATPPPPATTTDAGVTAAAEVPTTSQADRWATAFVTAIALGNVDAANAMVDWDVVFDTATRDLAVPEGVRGQFIARGRQTAIRSGVVAQLAAAVAAGGDLSVVRCRADGGGCHALMRVVQGTGLNYYDAQLALRDGQVRATDIDICLAGEPITATLRRYFRIFAAAQASPESQDLADPGRQAELLRSFVEATEAGDNARVIEVIDSLPAPLRGETAIQLARVVAVGRLDARGQAAALTEMRALCPDAGCVDLVAIDHHSRLGEYDQCLAAIDRLDTRLGRDPYLDVLRATSCLGGRDYRRAAAFIETAIKALPDLLQLYWIRVAIALDERNHRDTAVWLDAIAARFAIPFAELDGVPEYAEFLKSPDYREWKARRGR